MKTAFSECRLLLLSMIKEITFSKEARYKLYNTFSKFEDRSHCPQSSYSLYSSSLSNSSYKENGDGVERNDEALDDMDDDAMDDVQPLSLVASSS